jgi:hypothetical protein
MDFVILIIFLGIYYLRPQEWFEMFNDIRPIQLLSFLAFWSMFVLRRLKPRDLVQTPTDWMVVGYFVVTLISGFQPWINIGYIEAVLLFYFLAACGLDSIPRLNIFLGWWTIFILIIAALSIASIYGFDPLDSAYITAGQMKGRLVLNLSVFNNPNALAHGIVPVLPLLYYLLFWRRVFMKGLLVIMAIPLYCIYLTQSKGAILCGFATLLATLTFGRSKIVQVLIIVLGVGIGYGALYSLPRMNELHHTQTDAAIQGRVAALKYGMECMQTHFWGIGFGNFKEMFYHYGPTEKIQILRPGAKQAHDVWVNEHFRKATHGSYNQTGAEFGYPGLFFLVAILYCCIRTLLLVKSKDDDEERIRRLLFAMVVAYAISSWMVDFCYRPTFFMFVAAISAFHRHLLRKQAAGTLIEPEPVAPPHHWLRRVVPQITLPGVPIPELAGAAPALASSPIQAAAQMSQPVPSNPRPGAPASLRGPATFAGPTKLSFARRALPWEKKLSLDEVLRKSFIWNRLGLLDLILMSLCFYATILYWKHLIKSM